MELKNDISQEKMAPKREGPFEILDVLGPVTYQLKLPLSWKIHNVFHTTLLRPYKENNIYGQNFPEPPPEILNEEEVYNMETILKHRQQGNKYQFLIKWEGYPISEATWEPEDSFSDDGDILTQYKVCHQLPT